MSKATVVLKKELLELLPPTAFFLVVFHIVVFTRSLMGETDAVSMNSHAAATLGALVVGKSILVADALPLFRWFSQKRLILNVAWRSFLYLLVVLLFQLLEELIPLISEDGGVAAAIEYFIEEIRWTRFWATHLLFAVFLACYSLGTAMIAVIGKDRFLQVFLGWNRAPGQIEELT